MRFLGQVTEGNPINREPVPSSPEMQAKAGWTAQYGNRPHIICADDATGQHSLHDYPPQPMYQRPWTSRPS